MPDARKIVIALQFWEGDRDRAMRLAKLIADIEPGKNNRVEIAFFARFDAKQDDEVIKQVSRKFNVWKMKCRRQAKGWPDGCNAMALDLLQQANQRSKKEWKNVKAVYLMESDVLPLRTDWLAAIEQEWDEWSAKGKLLGGSWYPYHSPVGHINGNMLVAPNIVAKIKGLEACPPGKAWDTEFAPKFEPFWYKSRLMTNLYDFRREIDPEILFSSADGVTPVAVTHGIKDFSGERLARAKLFEV